MTVEEALRTRAAAVVVAEAAEVDRAVMFSIVLGWGTTVYRRATGGLIGAWPDPDVEPGVIEEHLRPFCPRCGDTGTVYDLQPDLIPCPACTRRTT